MGGREGEMEGGRDGGRERWREGEGGGRGRGREEGGREEGQLKRLTEVIIAIYICIYICHQLRSKGQTDDWDEWLIGVNTASQGHTGFKGQNGCLSGSKGHYCNVGGGVGEEWGRGVGEGSGGGEWGKSSSGVNYRQIY